jgi:membrane-bound serine protease (ClpP class)
MTTNKLSIFSILAISLVVFGLSGVVFAQPLGLVKLEATINPVTKDFLVRVIEEANRDGVAALVIQLDTPGGLLESTKNIIEAFYASKVPIVVWVGSSGSRAASAGALITIASDVATMANGTSIGAAHPVNLGGQSSENKDDPVAKKIENFASAEARSIAEKRGRPVDLAEKFVRESLSLTATEALNQKVIDLIVDNLNELAQKLNGYQLKDGRTIQVTSFTYKEYTMTFKDQLMNYLADPNIVYILMLIGIYGIIAEVFSPGFGVGIAGIICLLLAFLGLQVLPVNIVGIALILVGAGMMILDIFAQSHLALTTGGAISLVLGSFFLFNFDAFAAPAFALPWTTVFVMVGTITALFVFMITKGLLIQRKKVATGVEGMIGALGQARDELSPEGMVFVQGEYWKAIAKESVIRAGEEVVVESMREGKLLVRKREAAK